MRWHEFEYKIVQNVHQLISLTIHLVNYNIAYKALNVPVRLEKLLITGS